MAGIRSAACGRRRASWDDRCSRQVGSSTPWYLEGTPGNYSVTAKGEPFAHYKDEFRGNPRSLAYSAQWSTRSWDDGILEELARDMAAGPPVGASCTGILSGAVAETAAASDVGSGYVHNNEVDGGPRVRFWVAVGVVTVAAGVVAARSPRVNRWVRGTAQPRAGKLWRRATGRERVSDPTADNNVRQISSLGVVYPDSSAPADAVTEADGHPRRD